MTTHRDPIRRRTLGRREALEALAAVGSAVAASVLLPEKWIKPVVEAGVLPAHAQASVCAPPFTFDQCVDGYAAWSTEPSPVPRLVIDSMAYINTRCEGVPLKLTFIIQNSAGQTIYASDPKVYLTSNHGFAEAIIYISSNQIAGVPYLVIVNWEFINSNYGQTHCDWKFGITQR
jgi:hypothetical protein